MSHIVRLEDDQRLCELPPGQDMLEVGFVKVEEAPGLCVACSIVLSDLNKALDDEWEARKRE